MHPTLFRFGDFLVPTQVVFLVGGLVLSTFMLLRHASRYDTHWKIVIDCVIAACIGGVVFGRLVALLVDFAWFKENPGQIWSISVGGLNAYGGMIGVAVGVGVISIWFRHQYLRLTDLVCIVAPIFLVAASLGNLMQGAAFGTLSSSASGIVATHPESSMPLGFARHPVQLYMAALVFVLYAVILSYERFKMQHGHVTAIFLIGFPILREIMAGLRDHAFVKPVFGSKAGMFTTSIDTFIAFIFVATGIALLIVLRSRRF